MNLPRPLSTAAIAMIVGLVQLLFQHHSSVGVPAVDAFFQGLPSCPTITPPGHRRPSGCVLEMKGMGMGVSRAPGKKKNAPATTSNKGLKKIPPNSAGKQQQPFNVNASLLRLEKKYDELSKAAAKNLLQECEDDVADGDIVTSEYVVAARAPGYITDWVPIAQICLARPARDAGDGVADPLLRATVSCYCRELSFVASLGSRVFQSVPRHLLEYAVETSDSFHKHVMAIVEDRSSSTSPEYVMTKQQARQELQLEGDSSSIGRSEIKQQYRKLSFAHHPDRFVGTERSEAERQSSNEQYSRIQLAYETLSSGVRNDSSSSSLSSSWYQSLGGRARTDFMGPIELVSLTEAQNMLPETLQSALAGLQPDLVQSFVARSRQQ